MRIFLILSLLALAISGVSFIGEADGAGGKTPPSVHDDGGGGGAYPSQTGTCQVDGDVDGIPGTFGNGGVLYFSSYEYWRCNGNFWVVMRSTGNGVWWSTGEYHD